MKTISPLIVGLFTAALLDACSTPPPMMTVTVYEGRDQIVRLQTMPAASGSAGFAHPAFLSEQTVAAVLNGLIVEEDTSLIPGAFRQSGSVRRSRAFGKAEVKFLSPLLAKGLGMATSEEIVTFFETADISSTQRVVTSGGIYVQGEDLHVVLSNHVTKVDIWHDNEEYAAPYRLTPLDPISPEPGRLVFEPATYMTSVGDSGSRRRIEGPLLHVAVRYKEVPTNAAALRP